MKRNLYLAPEDGDGGVAAAAPAAAPTAAPTPAPAAAPAAAAPAPAEEAKGFWNPDWRERLAGNDEKALKQLGRYASPEDVWKKARALEQRLSSGELKPVLSKDAKPEEVAEYRKSLGIPESAEKYEFKDVVIDDADKPFIAEVLKAAHSAHLMPDQAKAVVAVWPEIKKQAFEKQVEADREMQKASEDTLRSEWGGEYRRNINLVHSLLDGSGNQELKDKFLSGRLADGTPIGSSPDALKMLLSLALINNPAGVVVPNSGSPMVAVDDEIGKIEKMMRTDRKKYDADEKIQERYRTLITARESMKSRA